MRNVVCMRRLLLMATASALALLTKYLVRPARTTAASAAGSLHDTDAPHNTDALHNTDAAPCSAAARADARLRNPVFDLLPSGVRVRDPAVRLAHGTFELSEGRWRTGAHYELYFTHYRGDPKHMWSGKAAYTVQMVRTTDWLEFSVAGQTAAWDSRRGSSRPVSVPRTRWNVLVFAKFAIFRVSALMSLLCRAYSEHRGGLDERIV